MRALVIGENAAGESMELRDVPDPDVAGECRIRVMLAGICGTDLQLLQGYAGFAGIPGHEFVGLVEDAPNGDRHWIGKRVVGEINVGCGACAWCRDGVENHCPRRTVLGIVNRGGAFASHVTLPATNLHEVPTSVGDNMAVFAEPTAAACQILAQMEVTPRARIGVVGDGRMGLLVGQVLRSTGASVTILGRHRSKMEVAQRLGLTARPAADVPPGDRYDITVDVAGRPEGLTHALELVRPRGTVVMKSTFHGEVPTTLWPAVVNEVTLVGSRCGPFDRALELLATGVVRTSPLLAATYPLAEFRSAFDDARVALKVLLKPSED